MYSKVVNICTAQSSQYVTQSGHFNYSTVFKIPTVKYSLISGYYMYRRSVKVRNSGQYTYRTVFIIRTVHCSKYLPHSSHNIYRIVDITY